MGLIEHIEKIIKFGAARNFAPIAPNFLRAKIYPNKVVVFNFNFIICSTQTPVMMVTSVSSLKLCKKKRK